MCCFFLSPGYTVLSCDTLGCLADFNLEAVALLNRVMLPLCGREE